MKKYRVLLNGIHFWFDDAGDGRITPHAWFTTRWIEALDLDRAREIAVSLIQAEPQIRSLMQKEGKPRPHIRVDEIREVSSFPVGRTLKPGLAFYEEGDVEGASGARELTLDDREA